jgi:5-methylcytosine-specific restriction endonuclease McrA
MLSLKSLRDEDLLRQLSQLVRQSRGVEADVVAHIGEVELRRLYAQEACSSMFEYCRRVLGLRENEAYLRITVARAARENPALLDMLRDGRLHLSGIARRAPHLTRQSSETVLRRASGMSHREIRELVCELEPKPDVASSVRRLPQRPAPGGVGSRQLGTPRVESGAVNLETRVGTPARPAVVEPLAPARYQVRFTTPSSRHIPAAVRRAVHERDEGRCAYRDRFGRRCARRHDLEFHHKHPFARGGDHSALNLTLMCRAHNTLLTEQDYGEDVMARFRAVTSRAGVPVDAYGAPIVVQPRWRSPG